MLQVCKDMFSFLHGISRKRLDAIKQSYITNSLETRTHGNSKHLPKHAFSTPEITHVTKFISNFAEANGILLPGRIPGYKRMDLQLLPTQMTKRGIWEDYMAATETLTGRTASYRSFCKIWRRYLPHMWCGIRKGVSGRKIRKCFFGWFKKYKSLAAISYNSI